MSRYSASKQTIIAAKYLEKAFNRLLETIYNNDDEEAIMDWYPFDKSLGDVVEDVEDWVDSIIKG